MLYIKGITTTEPGDLVKTFERRFCGSDWDLGSLLFDKLDGSLGLSP